MDPLGEMRINQTPYNYVSNNPIARIDPDGMLDDEYIFNSDGEYTGKVEKEGEHTGLILGSDDQKPIEFTFADPVSDPEAIDKGEITGVVVVGDEATEEIMEESGVNDAENQENKVDYILTESDASNSEGNGKMDYVVTAKVNNNGTKEPIRSDRLYVTQSKGGAVAHNNYNFGNYLWGAGAGRLGFSLFTAKVGAHLNSLRDPHYKQLDSKDDQKSIGLGHTWSKSK